MFYIYNFTTQFLSSVLASSNLPGERIEEAAAEVFDGGDEGGEGQTPPLGNLRKHAKITCPHGWWT